MEGKEQAFEKIVSLAKRRGFIFPGSLIYGGLAGTWDYGPYGLLLKENIKKLWWRRFVSGREDMYGIDSAILMNSKVWEASGHVAGFSDPLVEDEKTKKRYRADTLLIEAGIDVKGMSLSDMERALSEKNIKSPDGNLLSSPRQFNLMFKTAVGSVSGEEMPVYLRPETAQGMFVNFKNILDSIHPRFPFGIAQIGKAFRNEIAPRDFLFRTREFEIMEFEYFVKESEWAEQFEYWRSQIHAWIEEIGISQGRIREDEVNGEDRAHYSKRTIDFDYHFPFGHKELYGLAYRTDFDLSAHAKESGVDLVYTDPETGEKFIPHVIEPTFGLDRTVIALLCEAYHEEGKGDEARTVMRFKPALAPVKVAVFPLLKNKPELVKRAREIFGIIKKDIPEVMWDDNGNIGKRYRRQDELGTPFCVTVDFETLDTGSVTVRDRDLMKQERVSEKNLPSFLHQRIYL